MKKLFALSLLCMIVTSSIFAQDPAPKSPHDTVSGGNISITYGRPYKKGRVIFGELVPYGKVWRTGANQATQIKLDKPVMFDGKKLAPGTYTLFTIPGKDKWTIILNSQLGQWGAFGYDKVKDKDVLKADVPAKKANVPVEQFTITIAKNGFTMAWDQTSVFVPIKSL